MYGFIKALAALEYVEEIWLYGSRSRKDNTPLSDIDIAIVCPRATQLDWDYIITVIERADTLLKIDCVRFDVLEQGLFKENILKYKKILYEKRGNFMNKKVWKDSFDYLGDAVFRLQEVLSEKDRDTNVYLRDATIQRFEFTIELYWKVLKKILAYEKVQAVTPRDVMAKAFQFGLIEDEKMWLAMLDDRNNMSHAYKEDEAKKIFDHIKKYEPILAKTYAQLKDRLFRIE